MKILAGLIRRELQLQANEYGHCALYEDELQRVWPMNEENRKAKIEQFGNEKGFRLVYSCGNRGMMLLSVNVRLPSELE